jgi:hypothetical protein
MKTVCILGAGPAGLFAAHTAEMLDCQIVIISKKAKSPIIGAQYLHRPIPDLHLSNAVPDDTVATYLIGSKENYVERVYGDRTIGASWSRLSEEPTLVPAWDLREAYNIVWERYEPQIVDQEIEASDVDELTASFETVISTIPQWRICTSNHEFKSVPIVVKEGIVHDDHENDNFVLYNGTELGSWYRTSRIFGYVMTEGVARPDDPEDWGDVGYKVVGNNCDCHPNLIRTGRHGLWQRGILTHHTVEHTINAITRDSTAISGTASGGSEQGI